jgi:hypothetical protein
VVVNQTRHNMKRVVFIALFPALVFAQKTKIKPDTVCFTAAQAADISFMLDSLWAADDINNDLIAKYKILAHEQDSLIVLDSIQLANRQEEVVLLNEQIKNYKIKIDLLQPKWTDKKGLWFGLGILSTLGTGILVNQLTK